MWCLSNSRNNKGGERERGQFLKVQIVQKLDFYLKLCYVNQAKYNLTLNHPACCVYCVYC